jgi:5-methyltetrahydropteroyltriglutamate--homocysteine methyltransferase
MNNIKTTVVGSYPVRIDNFDLMDGYFSQKKKSWNKYINIAVNDMINAGIQMISDGQTRDPFVNIFTRKLKGCRIRERTEIIDKVEYNGPITVEDQKYLKNLISDNIKLIGVVTGPYTLTKSSVDMFYNDEKELAYDFAEALRLEAYNLQKYVDIISIDEPFYSIEIPEYGNDLIKKVIDSVSCPTRLHICGDITGVISEIVDMPVDILSHEFKASPKLFDLFREYNLTRNICLGCIRSDKSDIESVDEIVTHIQKGLDIFGDKLTQLAPDCGQRLLPRNVAFQKLKNLVKAGEIVYG